MQDRVKELRAANWQRLSAYQRRLLVSHRPDECEREWALARDVRNDLEGAFGPTVWDASVAILAEADTVATEHETKADYYGATLQEIADELEVTRERARQMCEQAMSRLRSRFGPLLEELLSGVVRRGATADRRTIDDAIRRAHDESEAAE